MTGEQGAVHAANAANAERLALSASRLAKVGGALAVLSLAISVGALIYEGVSGAERKEKLQRSFLSSSRFSSCSCNLWLLSGITDLFALRFFDKSCQEQMQSSVRLLTRIHIQTEAVTIYEKLVKNNRMSREEAEKAKLEDKAKNIDSVLRVSAEPQEPVSINHDVSFIFLKGAWQNWRGNMECFGCPR
jgi:hypothetical protein